MLYEPKGRKKFQTYISLWTERILGDYATECYDEVGRESSLSRGEQMMKCVGTGELCSLLRHGEQNALAGDQYCGHTETHLGPVRSPQHTAREKRRIAQHVSWIGSYIHTLFTSSTISHAASYTRLLLTVVIILHVPSDVTFRN
jgi:hypothetical protein